MSKDKKTIYQKNKQMQVLFDKYFKLKYLLIGLILIFMFSIYKEFIIIFILCVIFIPLNAISMLAGKMIPHITVELLASCTLLLGYMFGPVMALIFGPVAGFYGMFKSGHIRYLGIIRVFIISIVCGIMALFTGISFNLNYIIGILLMNIISFFIYLIVDPDPIQNYTHRASHILSNIFILRFVFIALHEFLVKFI